MKRICFALLGLVGLASAAEVVTVTLNDVVLYPADGGKAIHFPSMEECVKAAPAAVAPGARSRCHVINYVTKVGSCDPAEPPELPELQEGYAIQCPGSDTRWFLRATAWERKPFPSCAFELTLLPKEANPPQCQGPEITAASLMPGETPDMIRPEPLKCDAAGADPDNCIDPAYDPNTPPGEGPPGATTVDKVARN